jgi:hypothetical protein
LKGALSWKEVSDWSLQVVIHKRHREPWNEDVEEAIFALLSLDDGPDVSWAPSREQLIAHRDRLSRLAQSQAGNDAQTQAD